jgi:hypothetical protein
MFDRRSDGIDALPRWANVFWFASSLLTVFLSGSLWLSLNIYPTAVRDALALLPDASKFLSHVSLVAFFGAGVVWALLLVPTSRYWLASILSVRVTQVLIGFAAGFLVGTPTILWQYDYFLSSINSYMGPHYQDLDRASLSLFQNLVFLGRFYLQVIAPDWITKLVLIVGSCVILATRNRRGLAVLATLILFIVSRPVLLRAYPHHVILWLPLAAVVAAFSGARIYEALLDRWPRSSNWVRVVVGAVLVALPVQLVAGPQLAARDMMFNEERMKNIDRLTGWLKRNTEAGSTIAIGYFCFNPDVFYTWLEYLDVPVPSGVRDGRSYIIWWGHARALEGKRGYACATPRDVVNMKTVLDLAEPGQGVDPFTDRRFTAVQRFGQGANEVVVFRFDFAQE